MRVLSRVVPTLLLASLLDGCGSAEQTTDTAAPTSVTPIEQTTDTAAPTSVTPVEQTTDSGDPISVTPEEEFALTLYLVDVSEHRLREIRLATQPSWPYPPSVVWSPDGSEVAVINAYDDNVAIYDPATGVEKANSSVTDAPTWTSRAVPGVSVTSGGMLNEGAADSPDGTMTATASMFDGGPPVIEVRQGASNDVVSSEPGAAQAPFAWAPDSQSIAASSPAWGITLVDPHDGSSRVLVQGNLAEGSSEGSFQVGPPAWAPNGTTIGFTGWAEPPTG